MATRTYNITYSYTYTVKRQPPTYIIYTENNVYKALNTETGQVDYSSSDAAYVINQALNAIPDGGCIFLRRGTYTISTQIQIGKPAMLEGEGAGITVVKSGAGLGGNDMMRIVDAHDVTIRDLTFEGDNTQTGAACIHVRASYNLRFHNVEARYAPDNGMWVADSYRVVIVGCLFHDNGNPNLTGGQNNGGLEIDGYASTAEVAHDIVVAGCIAYGNYGPGFSIHNKSSTGDPVRDVLFQDCISYGNKNYGSVTDNGVGYGTYHSENVAFVNCESHDNEYAGFYLNGEIRGFMRIIGYSDGDPNPFKWGGSVSKTNPEKLFIHITGYNPVGVVGVAVPASGTAVKNEFGVPANVYVSGGTVSDILVNGVSTGLTSGCFHLEPGDTITLVYTAAPSWVWVLE